MSWIPQPRLQRVAVTLLAAHQLSLLIFHKQLQPTLLWETILSESNHRHNILNLPSTKAPLGHDCFHQAIPKPQDSGLINLVCALKIVKMAQMGGMSIGGLRLNFRAKGKCLASWGTLNWLWVRGGEGKREGRSFQDKRLIELRRLARLVGRGDYVRGGKKPVASFLTNVNDLYMQVTTTHEREGKKSIFLNHLSFFNSFLLLFYFP